MFSREEEGRSGSDEDDRGGGGDEDQCCGVRLLGLFGPGGWGRGFGRRRGRFGGRNGGGWRRSELWLWRSGRDFARRSYAGRNSAWQIGARHNRVRLSHVQRNLARWNNGGRKVSGRSQVWCWWARCNRV